jgi:hypothetical protein
MKKEKIPGYEGTEGMKQVFWNTYRKIKLGMGHQKH